MSQFSGGEQVGGKFGGIRLVCVPKSIVITVCYDNFLVAGGPTHRRPVDDDIAANGIGLASQLSLQWSQGVAWDSGLLEQAVVP
jgi:hypothetical protein